MIYNKGAVRTRFAPSPTGSLHVGGARTALFNYLFAKKNQGVFVLRIEDTDLARSTRESEALVLQDLKWLGLEWDEGPGIEGSYAPYRQTERGSFYMKALETLQQKKLVYRCFCTEEELEAKRKAALASGQTPRYDGKCRNLTPAEIERLKEHPFAWRLHIPSTTTEIIVHDLIRGDVHFEVPLIGDFVLMKSNGYPSYNFACVVDDHQMEISHVIRGDEHLTNTPRQILLYQALGWELPRFAHLSMILAADRTKLSKRHGTTALHEFQEKGFLPHGIINYITLLGWSPKDEREIFLPEQNYSTASEALKTLLKELSHSFSLDGVSKNPAIFDNQKLSWMNGQCLRLLSPENLLPIVIEFFKEHNTSMPDESKLLAILATQRQNFETLQDIVTYVSDFYLPGVVSLDSEGEEVLRWPFALSVVKAFEKELAECVELPQDGVKPLMKKLEKETGKKGKDLYWPIRVAISGKTHGPELLHLFSILGKDELSHRLQKTVAWFAAPEEIGNKGVQK